MDKKLEMLTAVISQIDDNQQEERLQCVLDTLNDLKLVLEKIVITIINIDSNIKKPNLIESQLILKHKNINEILVWRSLDIQNCVALLNIAINQINNNQQAEQLKDIKEYIDTLGKDLHKLTINIHKNEKNKIKPLSK